MSSQPSIDPSAGASLQAQAAEDGRAGTERGGERADGTAPAVADTASASLQRPVDPQQRAHSLRLRTGTLLAGGRLRVLRAIGAGGMGMVYEAEDLGSGEKIALKTLTPRRRVGVYRFKNEFRALADVHPSEPGAAARAVRRGRQLVLHDGAGRRRALRSLGAARRACCDEARLRAALRQLARGMAAIHAAGKLHRDLKPSNVLVTARAAWSCSTSASRSSARARRRRPDASTTTRVSARPRTWRPSRRRGAAGDAPRATGTRSA